MRMLQNICFILLLGTIPVRVFADGLADQVPNSGADPLVHLFPNWQLALVARFDITEYTDLMGDPNCPITGLTILNYGTADGVNDITDVYFRLVCNRTDVWQTMAYAGVWTVDGQDYPAWIWNDPAGIPWEMDPEQDCDSLPMLLIHADIGSCPNDGATVAMGLGYNEVTAPPGGLVDLCGWSVPTYDQMRRGKQKHIRYVVKIPDREYAAPADTIMYTVYYGSPGGPSISNFVITDTLPTYTHYVDGSASVAPDPTWDPDPGPPARLRWTLPGVASTVGGRTAELSFSVTVDWGNGEIFEEGSGDTAAPEGTRLDNRAAVEALGSGCSSARINTATETIVRRYRLWKVADQDLLFAPRVGYPDDNLTYSIYIRNQSTNKTWWNISVWDTVPPEITTWASGYGFDDPFLGWTMTPTPAAVGSPGWIESSPGVTLLTWIFDLPPSGTIELKWKASAGTPDAAPGSMAITKVSVMEQGSPGKVDGTGHSTYPRCFTHLASIALRTTYFSYVAQMSLASGMGLKINFYPLNRDTTFDLRKLVNWGDPAGFEGVGGVSESITQFQGTCAGFIDGGYGGCGVERAPAQYEWLDSSEEEPNAVLYKLTGNAPLLWILMPNHVPGDAFTYIPSTSLNFSGFCHYSFRRQNSDEYEPGWGESWVVFNTSIGTGGEFDPALRTTAHIFRWDHVNVMWNYLKSADLDMNSLWMPFAGCNPDAEDHYKIISSDARLTVYQGFGTFGDPQITFAYNEHGGLVPNAESGLSTSKPGEAGTFYAIAHHDNGLVNMLVGNHNETTPATFRVYHYRPRNPGLASMGIPATLAGTAGYWDFVGTRVAGPGWSPANPYVFGDLAQYDPLTAGTGSTANAWKIEWVAGGNITVNTGTRMFSEWCGGAPMHPSDGELTGRTFWHFMSRSGDTYAVLLFCPSAGMIVHAQSGNDYDSTYTTTGPDQCVSFMALTEPTDTPTLRRAYKFELLEGGTMGEMMAMYHQGQYREKFFCAPFVTTGVHYDVIAPPIVHVGQPFWITVSVILGEGGTKLDYVGTSTFTSTDPDAIIQSVPMDLYDYTWLLTDEGVKLFVQVTMDNPGYQSIVVNDTIDGSITGLTTVNVVAVDVKFYKEPRFGVAASGDEVEFRICWSNYSSGSAEDFVITDRVPGSMTYVQQDVIAHFCGRTDKYGGVVAYSDTTNDPGSYVEITDEGPSAATWLKWTIPVVGIRTTGCVCFKAAVN